MRGNVYEYLVGNGAAECCDILRSVCVRRIRADDGSRIADLCAGNIRDINRCDIHAHTADDGAHIATDQHGTFVREPSIHAFGIPRRYRRYPHVPRHLEGGVISDRLSRMKRMHWGDGCMLLGRGREVELLDPNMHAVQADTEPHDIRVDLLRV